MKKTLSILLAIAMIATLCITAFAATDPVTITETTPEPQKGDIIVKTVIDDAEASYSVTIPADLSIKWGDTAAYNRDYAVTSQLFDGDTLTVSATAADDALMNGDDALAYTPTGLDAETVFTGVNEDAAPDTAITIKVPDFSQNAIAVYQTTLTYTAVYVAA